MIHRNVRGPRVQARRFPRMGHRSIPGDHRRRPAGLDDRRLHHIRPGTPTRAAFDMDRNGRVNYIRNAVKATVDAYDGSIHLYVFDADGSDHSRLAAACSRSCSAGVGNARRTACSCPLPGDLFPAQAEIYRTFHMLDPQAFYNKEDLWDLAQERLLTGTGPRARCAHLCRGDLARRGPAGIPAAAILHAAKQGQPDRRDGGAVRRRASAARSWCFSSPSRS